MRATRAGAEGLTMAELTCLALVAEGVGHGWALGSELAPAGPIGRIWSLSRALTYRAIDRLVEAGLVHRKGSEPGHGRERTVLAATPAGRRRARAWLDEPVEHLRDTRTELLVKLTLRQRAGLALEPLLESQRRAFDPVITALTISGPGADLVDAWRREHARAVRRFLDTALHPADAPDPALAKPELRLSARNQLRAAVVAVAHGDVMSTVKVVLPDGQPLTAAITRDAATDLDLAPGDTVYAVVKATEVIVAKPL